MTAVDPSQPSLTQRCSLALEEKRKEKSAEEHLGMWMESELGILSPGAQPRSTPRTAGPWQEAGCTSQHGRRAGEY